MVEEIRQDDKVILSSEDGFSVPMIFNNLCGKNFIGKEYKDYIRHIAFEEMGLKPGIVSHYRDGVLYKIHHHSHFLLQKQQYIPFAHYYNLRKHFAYLREQKDEL